MENKKRRAKARIDELRKIVEAPRLVCDCEDLLPFAWRTPPVYRGKRCGKVLRDILQAERERTAPPRLRKNHR